MLIHSGCSSHAYISPSNSDKHCIKNFKTEGSIISGKRFMTEAPLASKSLTKIMDQLVARLPGIGFQPEKVDKKNGLIYALHIETLKISRERAVQLLAKISVSGPNPSIQLTIDLKPGQITFEGDAQHEFCEIISATEVESIDY